MKIAVQQARLRREASRFSVGRNREGVSNFAQDGFDEFTIER